MTWELEVKLDPYSTNYNFIRMYVHAADKDTFYLQIGNNVGQVSLCEKRGAAGPAYKISGRMLMAQSPPDFVALRLTLDKEETWTLYTKWGDEPDYHCEGSYDCKPAKAEHKAMFDLRFRYIKSRTSVFTIRSASVRQGTGKAVAPEPEPEPELPAEDDPGEVGSPEAELELLATEILNSRELIFRFDREVDISDAICFESEMGEAMITGYADSKAAVGLRTMENMTDGQEYSFTWQGLRDADDNAIKARTWTVGYEPPEPEPPAPAEIEPGQVTISEVMARPNGLTALPETEYVELMNSSDAQLSLQGCIFLYDSKATVIDRPCLLPPGGYAVLFREGREIYVAPEAQSLGLSTFPSALANAGKALALLNGAGRLIDHFSYPAAHAGLSWERSADGYHLCTDPRGGTPGADNSLPEAPIAPTEPPGETSPATEPEDEIYPGDIIFNELLPEPYANAGEYIELHNRSDRHINIEGLCIATPSKNGLNLYDLAGLGYIIPAGGYLLLTTDRSSIFARYNTLDPDAIREHRIPKLTNSSATLLLINPRNGGRIIDEITYRSRWHSPLIESKKGVALERINPFGDTQDPDNWTSAASTAGYGTPGYKNSQFGQTADTEAISITTPAFKGDTYNIAYTLDSPAMGCRIHIYNMEGVQVAEISSAHLMGTSGSIPWNADKLPTGVYILRAVIYGPNGQSKQYQQPFLIR
jgi:hypothetical protein